MRGDLFSEKALAIPIGNILSASFRERITAEYNHPLLKNDNRRGRRPQIDYVVTNKDSVVCAVESKWTANSDLVWRDIMWDMIRLELLSYHTGCDCLMILAGFKKKIDSIVTPGLTDQDSRFIFGRTKNMPSSKIRKLEMPLSDYESEFQKYSHVSFPKTLMICNPHVAPKEGHNLTFQVLVWRVYSLKNAKRVNKLNA